MWRVADVEKNLFFVGFTSIFWKIFSGRNGGTRTYAYRLEQQMLNHYAAAPNRRL